MRRVTTTAATLTGAAVLLAGAAPAQAADLPTVTEKTVHVSGASTTGCSYASGSLTTTFVSAVLPVGENGVGFGVGSYRWAMQVTDECAETGQANLRARYRVSLPGTGTYTSGWFTVASSGTLNINTGVALGVEFAVCDYTLVGGDQHCGAVD
ncbi:hypothetical protein AB0I00_00045 [Streptomyces sp. NPDC050803]|uniref:hypothetical protein n=1 Tax=unclassified Streptomyces TaxID=2593676 RepID=UPI003419AE01